MTRTLTIKGTRRARCPRCRGSTHRCKTGDAGCTHCDDVACGAVFLVVREPEAPRDPA